MSKKQNTGRKIFKNVVCFIFRKASTQTNNCVSVVHPLQISKLHNLLWLFNFWSINQKPSNFYRNFDEKFFYRKIHWNFLSTQQKTAAHLLKKQTAVVWSIFLIKNYSCFKRFFILTFSFRIVDNWSIFTRSCFMESRYRMVTVSSSSVWWSTVMQNGVPMASWRR